MHHEHTGNCRGQLEHLDHEQLHHVVEQLGSLGCNGHCHHPEHQLMRNFIEQQQMIGDSDDEEEYVDEFGVKRRRKRSNRSVAKPWLLSEV